MYKNFVLLFLIVTFLLIPSSAWWRRRRRRRRCDTNGCQWRWESCSRTCGGGTQRAIITIQRGSCGPACNLPSPRKCNNNCCPINCRWGPWSSWGSCSRSCGGGTATRTRSYSPAARCGGSSCWGSSTGRKSCATTCCPVNCRWGPWSSWSSCSRSCGGGTATRTRNYSPAARCGGSSCSGSSTGRKSCGTTCCPVNCRWGPWSSWGSCSRSCGGGTATRTRNYSPAARCGGSSCSGSSTGRKSCGTTCCSVNCRWGPWSSWGSCSRSCGGGTSTRNRIIAANASCGGSTCAGLSTDSHNCSTQCCRLNCEWVDWGNYSSCSKSCDIGVKSKKRSIRSKELCGGIPCSESNLKELSCNTIHCPENECLSNPCDENAICTDLPIGFTCTCLFGFTGNGIVCSDVDECEQVLCDLNMKCTNSEGSYSCVCNNGYKMTELPSPIKDQQCEDIDECKSSPCERENMICENTSGSFLCF